MSSFPGLSQEEFDDAVGDDASHILCGALEGGAFEESDPIAAAERLGRIADGGDVLEDTSHYIHADPVTTCVTRVWLCNEPVVRTVTLRRRCGA